MALSNVVRSLKTFTIESRRVLAVTRKPGRDEFSTIVKVTGFGILLIGLIGFLLQMGKALLFGP